MTNVINITLEIGKKTYPATLLGTTIRYEGTLVPPRDAVMTAKWPTPCGCRCMTLKAVSTRYIRAVSPYGMTLIRTRVLDLPKNVGNGTGDCLPCTASNDD